MMKKKIVFAAGGTGGHVFPAIAVADAFRRLRPDYEIVFVGSSHGNEENWVKQSGYPFEKLEVSFLKGASLAQKLRRIFALIPVAKQAKALLKKLSPELVIGSGGYVSGPLLAVAARQKIPTAIMEQNALAGLTNRILSRFVDHIFTSFRDTARLDPKKQLYFGNPVRQMTLQKTQARGERGEDGELHLLVFGGSQGAQSLNLNVAKALKRLSVEELQRLKIWHQAGKNKLESCREAYREAQLEAKLTEFIDDMGAAYAWADLIVCRAGATSIAEIRAAGKAAILVPFPHAAHNHQEKNADALVAENAAWKVRDERLIEDLPQILSSCLKQGEQIAQRARAAAEGARSRAAYDIAEYLLEQYGL